MLHFVDQLIEELDIKSKSGVLDLGLYMSFFTFDVMGELG